MDITNLTKSFGENIVMDNFSVSLQDSGITCFMGPSGCGKTTLMNLIANLIKPDKGTVKGVPDKVSVIFQEDRLLPWMTALGNVEIVRKKTERRQSNHEEAIRLLSTFQLNEAVSQYPDELSGGMRQRVNIARGLFYDFDLLIMDEPLKGLENTLKNSIINIVRNVLHDRAGLLITHDILEALMMADEIIFVEGSPFRVAKRLKVDIPYQNRNESDMIIWLKQADSSL